MIEWVVVPCLFMACVVTIVGDVILIRAQRKLIAAQRKMIGAQRREIAWRDSTDAIKAGRT